MWARRSPQTEARCQATVAMVTEVPAALLARRDAAAPHPRTRRAYLRSCLHSLPSASGADSVRAQPAARRPGPRGALCPESTAGVCANSRPASRGGSCLPLHCAPPRSSLEGHGRCSDHRSCFTPLRSSSLITGTPRPLLRVPLVSVVPAQSLAQACRGAPRPLRDVGSGSPGLHRSAPPVLLHYRTASSHGLSAYVANTRRKSSLSSVRLS